MKQVFFLKKQWIALSCVFVISVFELLCSNSVGIRITVPVLGITLGEVFLPYILHGFNFSPIIDAIFYYFPFYLYLLLPNNGIAISSSNLEIYGYCLLAVLVLLFLNRKEVFNAIDSRHIYGSLKMPVFINLLGSYLIALISEEIFFRYYIITIGYGLKQVVLVSAFLFTYAHFINRWSNRLYKLKNYILFFVLGIILGIAYKYTGSLWFCCIVHIIFNCSDYIILIKKLRKKEDVVFFNDYD